VLRPARWAVRQHLTSRARAPSYLDDRRVLGGVIQPDFLNRTTVALGAGIGDDDAVVRRVDLAHALQTNFYSHVSPS